MDKPGVKHIQMDCPIKGCKSAAFVQVLVFDDAEKQAKVDALANKKLIKGLKKHHKEGLHD